MSINYFFFSKLKFKSACYHTSSARQKNNYFTIFLNFTHNKNIRKTTKWFYQTGVLYISILLPLFSFTSLL